MKISYNVEIPEISDRRPGRLPYSEETKALVSFLESPKKSMCFEYASGK